MDQITTWLLRVLKIGYIAVAVLGLYLVVQWAMDVNPVVRLAEGTITPKIVMPGQKFFVVQPIEKLRDCPGRITRSLEGDCGSFELSVTDAVLPSGFDGRIRLIYPMPEVASSGTCWLTSHHRYWCDPLDWVLDRRRYVAPRIEFRVAQP